MRRRHVAQLNTFVMLAGALFFALPLCTSAQQASELIQAAPLVGQDVIQKLPAPLQNLIQSSVELNKSVSSWTPPLLSGRGEQISQAAQRILRAAISFIISALAWLVTLATHAVSIVAGIIIGIINWLLAFGNSF